MIVRDSDIQRKVTAKSSENNSTVKDEAHRALFKNPVRTAQ
jgi:hypothetical protein